MFDSNLEKKSLIIVAHESTNSAADSLMQLLGQKDDKEDGQVVGIKDGTVSASVWTETEYKDNKAKISSDQYIVFIGTFEESKNQLRDLKSTEGCEKFNEFGMQYSWRGKRAILTVEESIKTKIDYEKFLDFAKENGKKFDEAMKTRNHSIIENGLLGRSPTRSFITGLLAPVPTLAFFIGKKIIVSAKEKKEIQQQQYACLTIVFFLNELQKFLDQ